MAKRRNSKSMKRSKSKVSRKSMKRKSTKRKTSKRKTMKRKSKKVSDILSSTYGLAGLYKENQKGYKAQRVNVGPDAYKKKKMTPPTIPKNKKGKKVKSSSKSAKNSFLAGIQSETVSLPKQSKGSWISHVKKVYEEGKRSQPGYKYKNAMKDAKKTW